MNWHTRYAQQAIWTRPLRSYIFDKANLQNARQVLEVGCGDGRLTWRYAEQAASVVAIDPGAEKIALARASLPAGWEGRVDFQATDLVQFASQYPDSIHSTKFDLAILSWSL